jgi:hypothetical protein
LKLRRPDPLEVVSASLVGDGFDGCAGALAARAVRRVGLAGLCVVEVEQVADERTEGYVTGRFG